VVSFPPSTTNSRLCRGWRGQRQQKRGLIVFMRHTRYMFEFFKNQHAKEGVAWDGVQEGRRRRCLLPLALILALTLFALSLKGLATTGAEAAPRQDTSTVTIAEARALPAGTRVVVQGQLLKRPGAPTVLCFGLTRSLPPRCARSALRVRNVASEHLDARYGSTSWSARVVLAEGVLEGKGSKRVLRVAHVRISP